MSPPLFALFNLKQSGGAVVGGFFLSLDVQLVLITRWEGNINRVTAAQSANLWFGLSYVERDVRLVTRHAG